MAYQSFEELEVWKRSKGVAVLIYACLRDCRDFSLRDQMQRSAVSIPSNIAEGAERGGLDYARYLKIALGSAAELRTRCCVARDVGALTPEDAVTLVAELKEISRMLSSQSRTVTTRAKAPLTGISEPETES